jgi:hypothetical protein
VSFGFAKMSLAFETASWNIETITRYRHELTFEWDRQRLKKLQSFAFCARIRKFIFFESCNFDACVTDRNKNRNILCVCVWDEVVWSNNVLSKLKIFFRILFFQNFLIFGFLSNKSSFKIIDFRKNVNRKNELNYI